MPIFDTPSLVMLRYNVSHGRLIIREPLAAFRYYVTCYAMPLPLARMPSECQQWPMAVAFAIFMLRVIIDMLARHPHTE